MADIEKIHKSSQANYNALIELIQKAEELETIAKDTPNHDLDRYSVEIYQGLRKLFESTKNLHKSYESVVDQLFDAKK